MNLGPLSTLSGLLPLFLAQSDEEEGIPPDYLEDMAAAQQTTVSIPSTKAKEPSPAEIYYGRRFLQAWENKIWPELVRQRTRGEMATLLIQNLEKQGITPRSTRFNFEWELARGPETKEGMQTSFQINHELLRMRALTFSASAFYSMNGHLVGLQFEIQTSPSKGEKFLLAADRALLDAISPAERLDQSWWLSDRKEDPSRIVIGMNPIQFQRSGQEHHIPAEFLSRFFSSWLSMTPMNPSASPSP
ncbi:MAG: hypothetical protein Q7S00_03560, partial [bacterium]|nr:hypothetical protein [bacterium]